MPSSRRATRRTGSVDIGHLGPLKSVFSAELFGAAAGVLGGGSDVAPPVMAAAPARAGASAGAGAGVVQGLLGPSPVAAALALMVGVLLMVNVGLVAAVVMLVSRAAGCGK
jgi:hypothetical protein